MGTDCSVIEDFRGRLILFPHFRVNESAFHFLLSILYHDSVYYAFVKGDYLNEVTERLSQHS